MNLQFPPDLLNQGKIGPLWPVKGAPSKLQWWSIYRKRTFKSKEEALQENQPLSSQPRSLEKPQKNSEKNKKIVPKIVRQIPPR